LRKNKETTLELKQSEQRNSGKRKCVGVGWGDLVGLLQDMVMIWDFILSEMGIYWRV